MRNTSAIVLLIAMTLWQQKMFAQQQADCDLNKRIWMRSADTIYVEEISQDVFIEYAPKEEKMYTVVGRRDSLVQVLVDRYTFIKKLDSCLVVNFAGKQLRFCDNDSNDKSYSHYEITSYQQGDHLTIRSMSYEWQTYQLLDLKNQEVYSLPGFPQLVDQRYILGESHYYGEHDFKIYDKQTKDSLDFTIGDVLVKEVFLKDAVLRFEAKLIPACEGDEPTTSRYYEIDLKSGL